MIWKSDPATWRAVLIGTVTHREPDSGLPNVSQAANNLVDLAAALTAPRGLLRPGAVECVQDPADARTVFDAITRQPTSGTLLCYYTGHGLNADGRLCLALPGSVNVPGRERGSSLPAETLLEHLVKPPRRRVVLILDCCYAGLVLRGGRAANLHLLLAAAPTAKARTRC